MSIMPDSIEKITNCVKETNTHDLTEYKVEGSSHVRFTRDDD